MPGPHLVVGAVYRVRAIEPERYKSGTPTGNDMVLLESPRWFCDWGPEGGWGLACFRPIYTPKADLIQSLKAPSPKQKVGV